MTEKKKRFHFWDQIRGKRDQEQLNIDEEALREFEAVLHADLEAEDAEEAVYEETLQPEEESVVDPVEEEENLDELEMEVERSVELHIETLTDSKDEEVQAEDDMTEEDIDSQADALEEETLEPEVKAQDWQEPLPVRSPLEDSLNQQLEELKQIRSGLPEERRARIHEEAVRGATRDSGEVHYRRRRRQPPKASVGKWIWLIILLLALAAVWFFRGEILAALPSFERTESLEEVDPEKQLRDRVELFFSTAKVIEAESMTTFFSMTTMDDPQNYEENRESINALIDLKTSFELVQELQVLGISGVQIDKIDGEPNQAIVSMELNSVDPVLKDALSETTWLYREESWILDADQYLADLKEAQIAQDQVPVLPPEDNSDVPAGEVVTDDPAETAIEPETPMEERPSPSQESEDGFIQAGGFYYETEEDQAFTMNTLKFGIQREGFEKMVFTSAQAKADQSVDAPSFQMWLSGDNTRMTVQIEGDLTNLEIADYRRFSALIQDIEVEDAEGRLVFTFKKAVQVRPYEWKGLLIMDYEEKE